MGASQSTQMPSEDEEQEEEEEDDGDEHEQNLINHENGVGDTLVKRVLEQEPEMLPCHASASPLSPQLSTYGTPRIGPSIKVFDPYNVLAPPQFSRSFSGGLVDDFSSGSLTEVYLICHGECHVNLRDGLVWGRSSEAKLTSNGSRQARALGVFLKSQGVRFSAVYSSPLDRARATAVSICQEMNLSEDQIHQRTSEHELLEDTLFDIQGPLMKSDQYFSNVYPPANTIPDRDVPSMVPNHSDYSHRHRPGFTRKKSGKSRLQVVTGDQEADDEMSPRQPINHVIRDVNVNSIPSSSTSCIGVFTHSVPIKCVITGLLGCSAVMSQRICIEDSSVTVLQHSWKTGWQIKRINDTAHLRLL
ncbi:hypothetical protein Leryth_000421 [Lithospermum erythrorhizon]|nr:hypothetical protein Leryth_000421 [Lithospermum erythrorhizon]